MLHETHLRSMNGKSQAVVKEKSDGQGLGVRVSKQGRIRFQFRYKIKGKNKRIDLGYYPDLSLKQARDERDKCRAWLAGGHDPKIAREIARDRTLEPVTVKDALEYWIEKYARVKRSSFEKTQSQFNKHIYPYIGHYPLEQTKISHWLECFDRINTGIEGVQKPAAVAAGQILQACKQALKFCRVRGYAITHELDDLVAGDVGKKAAVKDRVLSYSELKDVLQWSHGRKGSFYMRYLCLLLIVFGARTQEVRLSTIHEWDLDNDLWTVPKQHSKTGLVIVRPIPQQIKPVIALLIKRNAKQGYLLGELREDVSVSGSGGRICNKLKHKERWTLHDLRSTFSTILNDLEVDSRIVDKLIGHVIKGSEKHYNHSKYLKQSAAALDMWCEWLDRLANPIDNVVDIGLAKVG
ncbi:site-specific integrase [Shewanella schlegeliana]|uniref:Integrase arm-type DNA-binding domain-containing protein n=1 Tax=Shewanella schlegeliana TaxID=190308 RepID=A0ABS1T5S3_9GAMM|nr:integrase arm-type DNA-binding domain-containing protein [Shewanella schlegeliana]MBL4915484.1 integrase arm-type DNA-binding domain-containing protein [Shewanella schlegeliana]MCL1111797.1 site-specific integrase [Shewanella schlegeliana]GIU36565.1 integrase [Shewanella schlegeliana]